MVVGAGGVGAFAAEFAARAGIGKLTVVDGDAVAESNRNRQLIALESTMGRRKVTVLAERLRDAVGAEVVEVDRFLTAEDVAALLETDVDFVIDAIDSVPVKARLIFECERRGIPMVSSMGAAGKLDPSQIRVAPLGKTSHCPLARAVRKAVRELGGGESAPAVFSSEPCPECRVEFEDAGGGRRSAPGVISYLPAAFGIFCAAEAVRHLLEKNATELEKPRI